MDTEAIDESKLREELNELEQIKSADDGYCWIAFHHMEKYQTPISSGGSPGSSSGQTL